MTKELELDKLFTHLRVSEPAFNEAQFLHSVNLALPKKRRISMAFESAITLVAVAISCGLIYHYFPALELLNQVPQQFTITSQDLVLLGSFAIGLSGLIYWVSEGDLDF